MRKIKRTFIESEVTYSVLNRETKTFTKLVTVFAGKVKKEKIEKALAKQHNTLVIVDTVVEKEVAYTITEQLFKKYGTVLEDNE